MKFILLALCLTMAAATPTDMTSFNAELFNAIVKERAADNIIFSPVSIRGCLALTYLGAEGTTATELQEGLQLAAGDKEKVAEQYSRLFVNAKTGGAKVKIANRVYVDEKFTISPKFNELASKYFDAQAESVKFTDSKPTADHINAWIEQRTENRIKNLITADSLDENTASVLVNAIYFKANWTNTFDGYSTKKQDFSLSTKSKVPVDMMFQQDHFLYGDLKELDATAVEMSYVDTDINMLVILPKQVDGLAALEAKLKDVDLLQLSEQLKSNKVRLHLPKFKIEFDISLQPVLEKLGLKTMFTPNADFSSLLSSKAPLSISEVKHKAFIEVNEEGTEAAAATYAKAYLTSFIFNEVIYDFVVDHPFFFAIKDKQNVYFAGHVVKF